MIHIISSHSSNQDTETDNGDQNETSTEPANNLESRADDPFFWNSPKPIHPPASKTSARQDGKHNRYINDKHFTTYDWLHYDSISGKVFCHHCLKAKKQNKIHPKEYSPFFTAGFDNWHNSIREFKRHEDSETHKQTTAKNPDIAKMLSKELAEKQERDHAILMKILANIRMLGLLRL